MDPQVEALLTKIEAKARATTSLKAEVVYVVTQGLLRDVQKRTGALTFVAGPPAGYAVHFTTFQVGKRGPVRAQNRLYVFDGVNMVERIEENDTDVATGQPVVVKKFVKIQLPPAAPGDDPLASGSGPFCLPINMKKEIVARNFAVALVPPASPTAPGAPGAPGDPEHSVHLKLSPRPAAGRVDFTEMHLWYDQDQLWPVRVRTYDSASEKETVVDLKNHKINDPADKQAIDTSTPTDPGWDVSVEPWTPGK